MTNNSALAFFFINDFLQSCGIVDFKTIKQCVFLLFSAGFNIENVQSLTLETIKQTQKMEKFFQFQDSSLPIQQILNAINLWKGPNARAIIQKYFQEAPKEKLVNEEKKNFLFKKKLNK